MSDVFGIPSVTVPIKAGLDGFISDVSLIKKHLYDTKTVARGITDEMYSLGRSLRNVGFGISAGITAPVTLLGKKTVDSFAEFDYALKTSLSIAGDVSKELEREVANTAKNLSTEITTTATDLVGSFYELISSGYSLQRGLKVLGPIAKFAHAGLFNLGEATTILVDAQKAMGLAVIDSTQNMKNLNRVSDVLIKSNQIANGTVREFSRALTNQAAAAARMYGIELEDAVSALAVMADQGLKGVIAGVRLSMVLRGLASAAIKHDDAFRKLGVRFFDLTGKVRPLYAVIKDLETLLLSMSDKERQTTLMTMGFSERTLGGLMPLIGQADKMYTFYNKLTKESAGITQDVVDKQLESFEAKMKLIRNEVTLIKIAIGEKIAPYILKIAEKARDVVVWFGSLRKETIGFTLALSAGLAALGPISLILGGILMSFRFLISSAVNLGIAFKKVFTILFYFPKLIGTTIVSAILKVIGLVYTLIMASSVFIARWVFHFNIHNRFLDILKLKWAAIFSIQKIDAFFETIMGGLKKIAVFSVTQILPAMFSVVVIISIFKTLKKKFSDFGYETFLSWIDAAQAFFINFRENFGLLFEWLKENWENIIDNVFIGIANLLPKLAALFVDFSSIMKDLTISGIKEYERRFQRRKYGNRIEQEETQRLAIDRPDMSRAERREEARRVKEEALIEYDKEHERKIQETIYEKITKSIEKIRAWDELPKGRKYKEVSPLPKFNLTLPDYMEKPYIEEDDTLKEIGDILPDLEESLTNLGNIIEQKMAVWAEVGSQEFYKSLYNATDRGEELQSGILSATQRTADNLENLIDVFSDNQKNVEVVLDGTSVTDAANNIEDSINTATSTNLSKDNKGIAGTWNGEVVDIALEREKETERATKQIEKNTREQIPIQNHQTRILSSILETLSRNEPEISLP